MTAPRAGFPTSQGRAKTKYPPRLAAGEKICLALAFYGPVYPQTQSRGGGKWRSSDGTVQGRGKWRSSDGTHVPQEAKHTPNSPSRGHVTMARIFFFATKTGTCDRSVTLISSAIVGHSFFTVGHIAESLSHGYFEAIASFGDYAGHLPHGGIPESRVLQARV